MMNMAPGNDILNRYFPDLESGKQEKLLHLEELYIYWNEQINVISRRDMDNFFLHHVLHSLSLSWYCSFAEGELVLDVGTGGGFPGIPMAILFPATHFLLIDSTAKKLKVVEDVSRQLGLDNVELKHSRIEELSVRHDYTISRAVASLPAFLNWLRPSLQASKGIHKGIFYLKGGDIEAEARASRLPYQIHPLSARLQEDYFSEKCVVTLGNTEYSIRN